MLIQDNFTMPNAAPGYWYAGKLSTISTEGVNYGKFYIYFKSNRDISDYMIDFYNINDNGGNVITTYSFDSSAKLFTITGSVFDEAGNPFSAGLGFAHIDYIIFVSQVSLISKGIFPGTSNYEILEDLLKPKL